MDSSSPGPAAGRRRTPSRRPAPPPAPRPLRSHGARTGRPRRASGPPPAVRTPRGSRPPDGRWLMPRSIAPLGSSSRVCRCPASERFFVCDPVPAGRHLELVIVRGQLLELDLGSAATTSPPSPPLRTTKPRATAATAATRTTTAAGPIRRRPRPPSGCAGASWVGCVTGPGGSAGDRRQLFASSCRWLHRHGRRPLGGLRGCRLAVSRDLRPLLDGVLLAPPPRRPPAPPPRAADSRPLTAGSPPHSRVPVPPLVRCS